NLLASGAIVRKGRLKCSECGWVQTNQRLADFSRHLKSHLRRSDEQLSKEWRCEGVLADDAGKYGLDASGAYTSRGHLRVGGCMKTFSRRDSLMRHLANTKCPCIGVPSI
ncbi:hypothetical protein C8J57DRAFT_1095209, partial [Mycena rebaudengoi]